MMPTRPKLPKRRWCWGAEAVLHLDAARWDEAVASAQQAVELDELHGSGECWREFALLVEEAAETGRPLESAGPV